MNKKSLAMVFASVFIFAVAAIGVHQYMSRIVADPDYAAGQSTGEVVIDIAQGATGSEIAQILYKAGVVKSSAAFFKVAVVDQRSTQISPGSHRLSKHIPSTLALTQLLDASRITSLIKLREGAWVSDVVDALVSAGFVRSEVEAALTHLKIPTGFTGTEGVLFPAQYSFAKGTSASSALSAMVEAFSRAAQASGIDTATTGFLPEQLLTIASIVQAEGDLQDFSKISRVIRNRLKIGMPLQLDSTVHFITHTRGKVFLSLKATQNPSPYNTYLHTGLPPGPIGNPGIAAMKAAVTPAEGDWIYFITVKPGDTRFTSSSQEFLTWKSEYEKNLRAGAFA